MAKRYRVSFWRHENDLRLNVVMVADSVNILKATEL